MDWESLGSSRLNRLPVMSGDRINQKLRFFRIRSFFWATFVFLIVLLTVSFSGKQFFFNSQGSYLQKNPSIEYPQLISVGSAATWKIRVKNSRQVWLSDSLIEKINLEQVIPRPEKILFIERKIFIHFNDTPEVIFLKVKPKSRGFVEGAIGGEREVFSVMFLVFP
jgi:hypothetical protein